MSTFFIAEVGINHNGSLETARQLIDVAVNAGCNAVKFQKRTIDAVYSPAELARPRESPFGETNGAQQQGLEFGPTEFDEIDGYCRSRGIEWFASPWDPESVRFLARYSLKRTKVASPMLTVLPLIEQMAAERRYTYVSTGMSTLDEVDRAVDIFRRADCPFELMHCNSTYPMPNEQANLRAIETLRTRYGCPVGYSGHERGVQISLAAVALGASCVERHITLDRSMYGSDQAASLEPEGLVRLVRDIRVLEGAMGDGNKQIFPGEAEVRAKLATPWWYQQVTA
jgi:N-acetylneuraminate synthase